MAMLLARRQKKAVYQRGVVACRKCATPIPIHKLRTLPDEFSVHCPKCGDRGLYMKSTIAVQELPERRRKPRD